MKKLFLSFVTILALAFSSSAQVLSLSELAMGVSAMNRMCPISCDEMGDFTSIVLDTNSKELVYNLQVNADYFTYEDLLPVKELMRSGLKEMLNDPEMKDLFISCAAHDISWICRFRWTASQYIDFKYTPQEMRQALGLKDPAAQAAPAKPTAAQSPAASPSRATTTPATGGNRSAFSSPTGADLINSLDEFKSFIALTNANCPIDLAPIGYVESVLFNDASRIMTYTITITNELVPYQQMQANQSAIRENIKQMFSTDSFKPFVGPCAKFGITLIFRYKWTDSQKLDFSFTPAELRAMANAVVDETEVRQNFIAQAIQNERNNCPMDMGDGLTLTDVYRSDNVIYYECTADERFYDISQMNANESTLRGFVTSFLSQLVMKEFVKNVLLCDCEVHFVYIGDTSGRVCEVIFTQDDLRQIIR